MKNALARLSEEILRHAWLPFAFVAATQLFLLYRLGTGLSSDVVRYSGFADQLVANHWNFSETLAPNFGPRLLHIAFITVVALLKTVAGSKWMLALAIINIVCHSLTAVLIGRATSRLSGSAIAGVTSLLLFAGCYEVFSWPRWALSDPSFVFLSLLAWLWFARLAVREHASSTDFVAPVAVAMTLVLYRPSALALIPIALALPLVRRPEWKRRLLVLTIAAIASSWLLTAWILTTPERWAGGKLGRAVERLSTETKRGEVVIQRPETFIAGVDSTPDMLHVFAARFIRFFQFTSASFSKGHNLLNIAIFTPIYALYLAAIALLLRGRLSPAEATHARLSLLWTIAFAQLHALTQLDYDWRYRLPVMAPMLIAGGVALARLLRTGNQAPAAAPEPMGRG